MYARSLVLLALLAVGCGSSRPAAAPPRTAAASAPLAFDHHVARFESSPWTFATNSFVIEGPTGLVAVDLQFTPSQATSLLDAAERATRKKVVLGVVLHPNPDKFNGTETLQKRGGRVVTSAQVMALIPDVFKRRTEAFASRYAPDWPERTPAPESFGSTTTTLDAGGTKVTLHALGAGCGDAHVVAVWDGEDGRHVFVGDLVANGNHSWLELGKTDEWLARLAEIRAMKPRFVHPGRGETGGPELLDAEEKYIQDVVRLVRDEKPTMPIPEGALDRVKAKVLAAYPDRGFEVFLDIGLPAVWEAQAKRK